MIGSSRFGRTGDLVCVLAVDHGAVSGGLSAAFQHSLCH